MKRVLARCLLGLCAVTACGDRAERVPESAAPAPTTTANAPLATLERVQRIADAPGDTSPLASAGSVALLAGGGVLIADTASRRVRRFSREGLPVATLGLPGIGPGQFQNIGALASSADTVFVWDLQLWRISAFDTTGALLFTRRAEPRPGALPVDAVWTGNGQWLLLETADSSGGAAETTGTAAAQPAARVSRWSIGMGAWTPLTEFPAVPGTGRAPGPATSPTPSLAQRWTARSAGDYWYARPDLYALTHYGANGDSLSSIVLGLETAPREILATNDGELWVRIDAGADSVEWHAFDAFGALRFRVRLPATLSVLAATADTVFAAGRDETSFVGRFVVRR